MSETCGRCGRRLKNPAYIEIGFGKTCAAKLGIALPPKKGPKDKPATTETGQPAESAAEGR